MWEIIPKSSPIIPKNQVDLVSLDLVNLLDLVDLELWEIIPMAELFMLVKS